MHRLHIILESVYGVKVAQSGLLGFKNGMSAMQPRKHDKRRVYKHRAIHLSDLNSHRIVKGVWRLRLIHPTFIAKINSK